MFKIEYISTTENNIKDSIIETKYLETFKEVRVILANSERLSEQLYQGNKRIKVFYNDTELFSYAEEELVYALDFRSLIHKIDFSLLSFDPLSVLLQQYVLNKKDFLKTIKLSHDTRLPTISLIKFKNGSNYCVDDVDVDGFVDAEVHIKIVYSQLRVDIVSKEKEILKTSFYSFDDIDHLVWLEIQGIGLMFEMEYKDV